MELVLEMPYVGLCSINKLYQTFAKNRGVYRRVSEEGIATKQNILKHMLEVEEDILAFNEELKKVSTKDLALSVSMTVLVQESYFNTKAGHISMKSGDIDSYTKCVFDTVFNKAGSIEWEDIGLVQQVAVDDTFIVHTDIRKVPYKGSKKGCILQISIVDKPELFS